MDLLPVSAAQFWDNDNFRNKKETASSKDSRAKKHDRKVLEVVLERMSDLEQSSSLLASASAPNVVLALFPKTTPQKERKFIIAPFAKNEDWPIGIERCKYNRWINALMQFILFIPSLSEMFAYTPKSLSVFIDFIDLYRKEQRQGKLVTTANSLKLLEVLRKKSALGFFLNKDPLQLFFDVIQLLMQDLSENTKSIDMHEADLLALHPEWMIELKEEGHKSWEETIEPYLSTAPKEFFVFQKKRTQNQLPKKQFFLSYSLYEMDAFIEFRPDHDKGDYLAYVKVEGEWLQCDDDKIIHLRPGNLPIALGRGFLFHYRKNK
ncbi:MAG TPA: hypothetical protein VLG44_05885 [Chlamydiales bacterium]|nr:hypothetical protein [Chlamydiales bacterium]